MTQVLVLCSCLVLKITVLGNPISTVERYNDHVDELQSCVNNVFDKLKLQGQKWIKMITIENKVPICRCTVK